MPETDGVRKLNGGNDVSNQQPSIEELAQLRARVAELDAILVRVYVCLLPGGKGAAARAFKVLWDASHGHLSRLLS